MLVQVIDVLEDTVGPWPADADEIEHREVLDHLAQAHAAGVRADGHAEFRGEQQDRQVLVDAGHPAGVDGQHVRRPRLQDLLEDHPVGDVLTDGDLGGRGRRADLGQAKDLIRARRLLHPVRVPGRERGDRRGGLGDPPPLVGVDRDLDAGPHRVPGEGHAPHVVGDVGAHLELDLGEPVGDRLAGQLDELLVGVADPAGRGGVGGVAVALQLSDPGVLPRLRRAQDGECLVRGERVVQVAEVDQADDLLGRHVGEQPPHRLARHLGGEVPGGVDHRADGHVHDALLRTEPAELAVADQGGAQLAEVGADVSHLPADDVLAKCGDGGHHDVVAAPDGEAQRVPFHLRRVRAQHGVGGRVVGIGVHRVRPVVLQRGREADVVTVERDDPRARPVGHAVRHRGDRRGHLWLHMRH